MRVVAGILIGGLIKPRSLKSTTTATMVGGPKEFGGTKGCNCIFERGDQKCCIVFLKTKIDQEMNI